MENNRKDIMQFQQIIHPIVKREVLDKPMTQFGLGYRSLNADSTDFVMKFKIVSPWNQVESIKIIHGYSFTVNDAFVIHQNSRKLAHFFAFLVAESLRKVNCSLTVGEIEIPSHQSLVRAIFLVLITKLN